MLMAMHDDGMMAANKCSCTNDNGMQAVGGTRVVACQPRNFPDCHVIISLFLKDFPTFFLVPNSQDSEHHDSQRADADAPRVLFSFLTILSSLQP
jgi:hypothetical protein